MADPVADLTGTTVGRFTVRARLGAGGMGEVYRADDTKLKRSVALKRMAPHLRSDARYRQRFLKEAQRASGLTDQHIAGLYDLLEEGGETYLVMEYVEGETLRQRLQRPLSIEEFLEIAAQCGEALVAAHARGLVHRDLKPENIMLTPAGQVKVLDFGVAKRLPRPEETAATETFEPSTAGGLSGTPAYMAPETLLEKEADGRADIFSLGIVFYEALTGRHPFLAGSFVATSDRILREAPAPLLELNPRAPAELERIVAKMLAKRPDERYQTAADLLVDLRAVQRGAPLPGLRSVPTRGRRRVAPAALALLLLAALLVPAVRERLLCAVGRCPLPAQKNLVVLPFRAIAGGEDQVYCDGLTETVTAKLSQLTRTHSLQVTPASEVRARAVADVQRAGAELGATLVLEASWERAGDMVRINLVLVEADAAQQLRTATLTERAADRFALQDQVVASAVEMLEVGLQPQEAAVLTARETPVSSAHDFYLLGRGYLQNYERPENIENALRAFHQALAQDPAYARAHAGLGEALWRKYEHGRDAQLIAEARQACQRALSTEPKLAAAHLCLGTLANGTGEYEQAAAEFARALEGEPTSDAAYRGLAAAQHRLGQLAAAEETYRKAIATRPNYWASYNWLGDFFMRTGRYREASEAFEQVTRLAPGNARGYYNLGAAFHMLARWGEAERMYEKSLGLQETGRAHSNLGTLYFFRGDFTRAARTFEKAVQLSPKDEHTWGNLADAYRWAPGERQKAAAAYEQAAALAEERLRVDPRRAETLADLALYHAKLGQTQVATQEIERALALAPHNPRSLYYAATIHLLAGDDRRALEWLNKAVAARYAPEEIRADPEWRALQNDPTFKQLLGIR